jgi:hemerythrin-like domain-containing protein
MEQTNLTIAEQILREHEVVREIIRQLEMMLEEGLVLGPDAHWGGRLHDELLAFRRHLQRHFALEEAGGFMLDVVALMPQAAERVEQLRHEHGQILAAVDELISRSNSLTWGVSSSFVEFHHRVLEVLSVLKHHEAVENRLIQRAFYQEAVAVD